MACRGGAGVIRYNIVYADPPWSYKDKALSGNRGACCKYDVMDTSDISKLPIGDIAAKDSVLFMWVTMPKLNECFGLIESWGFQYKTCAFTWVKRNRKSPGYFWGMGRWTRANAELCLLATKGKPKVMSHSVHSIIDTPIEGHSKKPDVVRDKIVELCGDLPRIELFARQSTPGWTVFGNEVEGSVALEDDE
jgi:N6-adenosine-specific RNA methylase IME4